MFGYRLTAEAKRYGTIFLLGLAVFGLAVLALLLIFRTNYSIHLSKDFVEYGEDVRVTQLVDKIGDTKISESMRRSSNTIVMDEYEVTFSKLDTSSLGEKTIEAKFSDENIQSQLLTIQVVDTTPPVIHVERPNEKRTYTLKQIENKEYLSEFDIQDACTPFSKLEIEGSLVNKEAKKGDQTQIEVYVIDENGNVASASLPIEIVEDEQKDSEITSSQEASSQEKDSSSSQKKNEPKQNQNQNSNSLQKPQSPTQQPSVQQSPTVQQPTQIPTQPQQPVEVIPDPTPNVPERPQGQSFMFSDGYDMHSAPAACEAALNASGYPGACVPIQDSEGIYLGMQLEFY